jgi:hypothetical protein
MYAPDGSTAQVEEKIAPKDLPQAVTDTLKQQFPGATIRSGYKVARLGAIEYALTMSRPSQSKLILSSDGMIISREGKKALDRNP